jgi:alanyl-tRNA synthetase
MTLPREDTVVTFPAGSTSGTATVLHVEPADEGFFVLLDSTPVHPVDAGWPDQLADRAVLEWNGGRAEVVDCLVAATDGTELFVGEAIPVRKGTEGWAFVAAHRVTEAPPLGIVVTVAVDEKYRAAVSVGHTGCHLASLALNRALANRWSKTIREDALGAPNFDAEASDTSRILERGSHDTYRLGKSLRKRGFRVEGIAEELAQVEAEVNATLAEWVAARAPVRIDREGDRLTDRRTWVCELPDGVARIPCGGTHASNLSELKGLTSHLSLEDQDGTPLLVMVTTAG